MIDGILNVYKEEGYTSHDVVAILRGVLHQKKIGHTGTLDPDAEGVLPVCLGQATKVCDMMTDHDKTYRTVMLLGKVTDTQDVSGTVLKETGPDTISDLEETRVIDVISSYQGDRMQIPPMYSAKKVNGKKLYDLAREGITVERKPCPIHIDEIEVEWIDLPRIQLRITCSKGTYIRTICHDIGEELGCGACMETLQRIRVGTYRIEDAVRIDEIKRMVSEEKKLPILALDEVFYQYEKVTIPSEYNKQLYNGAPVPAAKSLSETTCRIYRVYDSEGEFIGLYEQQGKKLLLKKMFYNINDR